MNPHELFGPRKLGWRPVTTQGWAMLWAALVAAALILGRLLWR
jgi:hypothetical protein